MGLLDFVENYARPIINRVEDALGIEHAPVPPTPPAQPAPPAAEPVFQAGGRLNPLPPCDSAPKPPAVQYFAPSGGKAGASPTSEFDQFLDRNDRPAVERVVRGAAAVDQDQSRPAAQAAQVGTGQPWHGKKASSR